jgi:hypothetical protein
LRRKEEITFPLVVEDSIIILLSNHKAGNKLTMTQNFLSNTSLIVIFTLVQIRFLKTSYFGQHNEDGTMISPIMPSNTLFLGLLRAYRQFFNPVILDSKMDA